MPRLEPGVPVTGSVPTIGPDAGYVSYEINVPARAFLLALAIEGAPADLDIILYRNDEVVAYSELTIFNETLEISRITEPVLEPGSYEVEVAYQYTRPPVVDGRQLTEIPFRLTARIAVPESRRTLGPGDTIADSVRPEEGMVAIYDIDVPRGAEALRVDISRSTADLDLFLNRLEPSIAPFESDYWSQSIRSSETIVVTSESYPPLRSGRYVLMVIDQLAAEYPSEYTLTIHDRPDAPESLRSIPPLPEPGDDLDRAVLATVELLAENGGGSGVLVSPQGHIVSNWHVVAGDSGDATEEITVGFTLDPAYPAVEMYRAEVLEAEPDRDLALLQIVAGRYGQPIPRGTRFPYLDIAAAESGRIGDDLHLLGYPSIGGTGSRVSITYSRGVIAGFQTVPFGRLIKTDGEINEGSSGGAALNDRFQLLGLPTEIVGLDAGQIAYVYPISAMPRSWHRIIGR
jgi:S1-C subfamily serine protease